MAIKTSMNPTRMLDSMVARVCMVKFHNVKANTVLTRAKKTMISHPKKLVVGMPWNPIPPIKRKIESLPMLRL